MVRRSLMSMSSKAGSVLVLYQGCTARRHVQGHRLALVAIAAAVFIRGTSRHARGLVQPCRRFFGFAPRPYQGWGCAQCPALVRLTSACKGNVSVRPVPAAADEGRVPGKRCNAVVLVCHRNGCYGRARGRDLAGTPNRTGTGGAPGCVICAASERASRLAEDGCRAPSTTLLRQLTRTAQS